MRNSTSQREMEHSSVSVEDFQTYHNNSAVGDADGIILSSQPAEKDPPSDLTSCDLEDDSASLSGSAHHSSGPDDEAVFDAPSRTSSPRTSHGSSDEGISILESVYTPSRHPSGVPFTPSRTRSPFHHPSSVRAMQLDTTPPHLTTPSSQQQRRNKLSNPSRQTSTPRSNRSHRATPSKIMNSSPTKILKKEHPLVLLHITLLPLPHHYSPAVLETVLPPTIFANWKLLLEKTTPTVLHRGVLIPHPREDYDLLEERMLESLELKQPRILKCGHFHLSPEEHEDVLKAGHTEEEEDLADADICDDCGRRVRDGRFGDAGTGSKRWDVKVFAANGLMRAGAWGAAWREMERVDIEILPWMEESMRRELEFRGEEEERLKREEETARKEEGVAGLDDERLREIYGHAGDETMMRERAQEEVDGLVDETPPARPMAASANAPRSPSQSPFKLEAQRRRRKDVPLWDLLRNYLYLAAHDPRNLAIFALSAFVLLLSIRTFSSAPSLPVPTPLETPSHIVATALPKAAEKAFEAVTNGESAVVHSGASVVSGGASVASAVVPTILPTSEPDAEKRDGAEESSWTEAAEDVVRKILDVADSGDLEE